MFEIPIDEYQKEDFMIRFKKLIIAADEIEEQLLTGTIDHVIFG